ncbi:YbaB/EbfC family nucleoid-associated protein [Candidatus Berkelbacteria bacterium]|nr:YbaB/EbfC family nucleoid-associated protein [Candidatus Berkelbacteria bacterium]MBI4029784.1 YbaB/EbfC family nucleoid-associated protein [Candidatus Berkelbacteria bacterium]
MDFKQLKQLYGLQKKAKQVQKELKDLEVEAKAEGVVVVFDGEQHLNRLEIDETMLSPEKKRDLEEALKKTISEAISRVQALAAERSKEIMKDMGLNIPGMG